MMVDRVARLNLRIPQARQDLVALLHRDAKILSTDYEGNDVLLTSIVPHSLRHKVKEFEDGAPSREEGKTETKFQAGSSERCS
jgi:GTP-binding protein HflX